MKKERIAVLEIVKKAKKIKDINSHQLNKIKKAVSKKYKLNKIMTNIEILTYLTDYELKRYKKMLITKPTRTISGVAVVSIMAMPLGCPHGKCIYCPGGINSSFGSVPQSYTGKEPATMRAIRNNYDPYLQIMNRLEQYVVIGQIPEKVELIIMGGTFPAYPKNYRDNFIYYCYKAMNDFSRLFYKTGELEIAKFKKFFELPGSVDDKERAESVKEKLRREKEKYTKTLKREQEINENSKIKCVGLTIETRPDWGRLDIGIDMLRYGTTRIELGVQTVYNNVLKRISRGHTILDTENSIRELKDLGFKLNFHLMPGLPKTSKRKDIRGMKKIFTDPRFKPDMVKIYPTMVYPGTKLHEFYKKGRFKPIRMDKATEIITEFKRITPRYCRIMRLQRDIPTKYGEGVERNNLRQYVEAYMKKKNLVCNCIRCREIKRDKIEEPIEYEIIEYEASGGKEFFISLKDGNDKLLGFVRLRFPGQFLRKEITPKSALIRELHVYGTAASIGKKGKIQHKGFGKQLMEKAEEIALKNGKDKLVVISGVGVRGYYKKLGYSLEGPYTTKKIAEI